MYSHRHSPHPASPDCSRADAAGGKTGYSCNPLDRLTAVTDPCGLKTTYSWDRLDEETSVASPDSGATTRTVDAAGNGLTLEPTARGMKTSYQYDALDRPIEAICADGKTVVWHYDQGTYGIGHLTTQVELG